MSVFAEQVTNPEIDLEDTNQSFLEVLVKAKGDKFKDPEVLAKSKLEADRYIESLKAKEAELAARLKAQEELEKEKSYLEGLKKDIMEKAAGVLPPKQKDPTEQTEHTTLKPEDIESLLEKTLQKKTMEDRAKTNLTMVEQRLEEEFGTEAAKIVEDKARQLGVDKKRLSEIAAESPEAFFKLVEVSAPKAGTPIQSTVNTLGMKGQVRDFRYYEALRKSNPKLANDPKYYADMERDLMSLGQERFYK